MTELEGLQIQFKMMERENKRLMELNARLQTDITRALAAAKHAVSPEQVRKIVARTERLEKKVTKLNEQLRILRSQIKKA